MQALRLYAGPAARRHIERNGLSPRAIRVVAGAAGGPKGLILSHLDRHIFGRWLAQSAQPVHLLGASIGAWRMATGMFDDAVAKLETLAHDYIHQSYEVPPGRTYPTAREVSRVFAQELSGFFAGRIEGLVRHPRYRLHVVVSRGRHLLGREGRLRTPLGYLGAALSNAVSRQGLSLWLERVLFSSPGEPLPIDLSDLRHRRVVLDTANFEAALLASCSIPFVLQAVHDIAGAPPGAYWDGGITDYHLHWNYPSMGEGLALYPHFQQAIVPGWLDKPLRHRHRATPALDNVLVLAPDPAWVASLPGGKLPDRTDFKRFGTDTLARARVWQTALDESERLAEEWARWLDDGAPAHALRPL